MSTKNNKKVQTTEPALKTPLLRLLLKYFGNLSVQLYLVKWGQRSMVNFVWNIVLVGSFIFEMSTRQGKYYRGRAEKLDSKEIFLKKPLYRVLISTIMRNVFPVCYFVRTLYFIAISLRKDSSTSLIHLLDQLSTNDDDSNGGKKQPNRTSNKALCIFVAVVLIQHLLFLLTIFRLLANLARLFSPFGSFMQYVTLLTLHQNANIVYLLVIYCKFATLRSLKTIIRRFKESGNIAALQLEIGRLATLNSRLHHLVSFPYIFSLVPYIIQALIAFTCIVMDQPRDTDAFAINFLVYTVLVVSLGSAIERQLTEVHHLIWEHLKGRQQHLRRLFRYSNQSSFSTASLTSDKRQQCLKWVELVPLYKKSFQLKIHNFFTVNWRFVFLLGVFLCNLVVLISQTSAIN